MFLTHLPSEIRNTIYVFVFSARPEDELEKEDEARETHSQPRTSKDEAIFESEEEQQANDQESGDEDTPAAHPLSLLLTCRQIALEATVLAFATHTFSLAVPAPSLSFFALRLRSAHLSYLQFSALSHLALPAESYFSAGESFANMMLLFPGLKSLELTMKRGKTVAQIAHSMEVPIAPNTVETFIKEEVLRAHVPWWWYKILGDAVNGPGLKWQAGERWSIVWPQFSSSYYVEEPAMTSYGVMTEGNMSPDAVGNVPGVELCACECGKVTWLAAILVQETGREIQARVRFVGYEVEEKKVEFKLVTEPEAPPLPLQWSRGGAGWAVDGPYQHDSEESKRGPTTRRFGFWGRRA